MKTKELKNEIGVIICEHCDERDNCKVYECNYLKKLEKAIATFINGYTTKFLALLTPNKTKTLASSPITKTNAIAGETPRRGVS